MLSLSPLALTLSVACGLALAGADYFRKAVPHAVPTRVLLFYFLAGQLPLLAGWLAFNPWQTPPALSVLGTAAYLQPGLADAAASFMGNLLFIVAVRRSPMSLVVPLLSLIPVFTVVLAALVLQEWPSPRQGLGILATAAGVFCIYQPAGVRLSPMAVWRNFRAEPGTAPMLCVAFCWSVTAPLDKLALAQAGVGLHALVQVALLSIAAGLWIAISPHKSNGGDRGNALHVPAGAGRIVLGASLTAGLSYGLQLAAYQQTLVAFVEALKRSIEITAVLVIGLLFLHEQVSRNKLTGIALIVCGVPMMILPSLS